MEQHIKELLGDLETQLLNKQMLRLADPIELSQVETKKIINALRNYERRSKEESEHIESLEEEAYHLYKEMEHLKGKI